MTYRLVKTQEPKILKNLQLRITVFGKVCLIFIGHRYIQTQVFHDTHNRVELLSQYGQYLPSWVSVK